MALGGKVVQRVTVEAVFVGDPFGRLALGCQLVTLRDHPAKGLAVDGAVGAHGHARHRLGPARDDQIAEPRRDLGRADMDGGFGRPAFAVDRHGGDRHGPARAQQRGAGDIGRLLADLGHVAEDDVFDLPGLDARPGDQFIQGVGAQMIGPHAGQSAAKLANGRADRRDHIDRVHRLLPRRPDPGTLTPFSYL